MKIALIGASGFVGRAVLREALDRGHQVTAIARAPEKIGLEHANLTLVKANALYPSEVAAAVKGHDVVISAYNPGWTNPDIYSESLKGAQAIQDGVKRSGVKRFITVGGAGSLFLPDGSQLVDAPGFPADFLAGAQAARDYLDILRKEEALDWTFVSPAIEMHQGTSGIRKGTYRKGLENPVLDESGRSILSVEDLALAIVDETENNAHIRQRFTAAY